MHEEALSILIIILFYGVILIYSDFLHNLTMIIICDFRTLMERLSLWHLRVRDTIFFTVDLVRRTFKTTITVQIALILYYYYLKLILQYCTI